MNHTPELEVLRAWLAGRDGGSDHDLLRAREGLLWSGHTLIGRRHADGTVYILAAAPFVGGPDAGRVSDHVELALEITSVVGDPQQTYLVPALGSVDDLFALQVLGIEAARPRAQTYCLSLWDLLQLPLPERNIRMASLAEDYRVFMLEVYPGLRAQSPPSQGEASTPQSGSDEAVDNLLRDIFGGNEQGLAQS